MTVINLLTWEGYAVYRALQGKAIPSFRVWDNARSVGHSGGNYQKDRYFEAKVFDGSFCKEFSGYCRRNPTSGKQFLIEKSDGTLGATGTLSSLFSDKAAKKAYLNIDIEEYLQSIGWKSALPPAEHLARTKAAVQEVASLLRTSGIDTNFYRKMKAEENPSAAWLSLTSSFEMSIGELSEDINATDIPQTLASLAERLFSLSYSHRDLISGASGHSFFLGDRNWFALMFAHCFKPKVYQAIKRGQDLDKQQQETNSSNTSTNSFSLREIADTWDVFYIDAGMAAQTLGLPTPFTEQEVKAILEEAKDLSNGIQDYQELYPDIESHIDALYDVAVMANTSFKSVCSIAKSIGWSKENAADLGNLLAQRLTGDESLSQIYEKYADRIFEERLSQEQKDRFRHRSIYEIVQITGATNEEVAKARDQIGAVAPFSLSEANGISKLLLNQPLKIAYINKLQLTPIDYQVKEGSKPPHENVYDICAVTGSSFDEVSFIARDLGFKAPFTRSMADQIVQRLTGIPSIQTLYLAKLSNDDKETNTTTPQNAETALAVAPIATRQGNLQLQKEIATDYRRIPIFSPSKAEIPEGYLSLGNDKDDLEYALGNPNVAFRSYFNDLPLLDKKSWVEETLFVPAFNESLYAKLVVEYHRYSMTQLRDQRSEVMKHAERKGAGIGALLGLITGGGLMAPFMAMMGANLNKMTANNVDPSKPIEEFLPDPLILFMRDEGSYLANREAYQSASIKRRVCLHKKEKADGNIYWDVFPMILLQQQAIPAQVFKWEESYFLRPITAGLTQQDISELGYNPFKMRRSLSYHPKYDITVPSDFLTTSIVGPTIEKQPVIFKTGLREDRSFPHYYFDYPKEAQVF